MMGSWGGGPLTARWSHALRQSHTWSNPPRLLRPSPLVSPGPFTPGENSDPVGRPAAWSPRVQQWSSRCPGGLRPEKDIPGPQVSEGHEQILPDGLGVGGPCCLRRRGQPTLGRRLLALHLFPDIPSQGNPPPSWLPAQPCCPEVIFEIGEEKKGVTNKKVHSHTVLLMCIYLRCCMNWGSYVPMCI